MVHVLSSVIRNNCVMKIVAFLSALITCGLFEHIHVTDLCSVDCVKSQWSDDLPCFISNGILNVPYKRRTIIEEAKGRADKCAFNDELRVEYKWDGAIHMQSPTCLTKCALGLAGTIQCDDELSGTKNDRCRLLQLCKGSNYECESCEIHNGIGCVLRKDWCVIRGHCVEAYERESPKECKICNPCKSTTQLTNLNGYECDDGQACTKDDQCVDGHCKGKKYPCPDFCKHCNGEGCALNPKSCFIEGKCYADNDVNPQQECQVCNSSFPEVWTARTEAPCDDENQCTYDDVCTKEGLCDGQLTQPEGCPLPCLQCNGTSTCALVKGCYNNSTKRCGCNIEGTCYEESQYNPNNPCTYCDTHRNSSGWSKAANGKKCDDRDPCTRSDRCQDGDCKGEDFLKECSGLKEKSCVQSITCNGNNCFPKYYDSKRQCHQQLDECDYPDIYCRGISPTCDYCGGTTGCVAVDNTTIKETDAVDVEKAKVSIYDPLTDSESPLVPHASVSAHLFYMVPSATKLRLMFKRFETTCGDVTLVWELERRENSEVVFTQSDKTNSSGTKIVEVDSGLLLEQATSYDLLVVAKNIRNTKSRYQTDYPILVDTTPPQVGKVYDGKLSAEGVNQDVDYQSDNRTISANWNLSEFTDKESGLLSSQDMSPYWMAVGTARGMSDVHSYTPIHLCGTREGEGRLNVSPNLDSGRKYYVSIRIYNQAGLHRVASSNGIIVDASPPTFCAPFLVVEGENETTPLVVQLAHSRRFYVRLCIDDHESGVEMPSYVVCETTRGCRRANNDRETICTDCIDAVQVPEESYLLDDGFFINDANYTVKVTVRNGAGLRSVMTSQSVVIDYDPPNKGQVYDGLLHEDVEWQKETRVLGVRWEGFTDPSGVVYCETAAYAKEGKQQLTEYAKGNGTTHGSARVFVQLEDGLQYFVSVRCYDIGGRSTDALTNGVVVDSKAPKSPREMIDVRYEDDDEDDVDRDFQVLLAGIRTKWSTFEANSGIDSCSWYMTRNDTGDVVADKRPVSPDARKYAYVGRLHMHVTYVAWVECKSRVGLTTAASTDGITPVRNADVPRPGTVYDLCPDPCNATDDVDTSYSPDTIKFRWDAFVDATSGIDYYEWSLLLNCTLPFEKPKQVGLSRSVVEKFRHPLGIKRYCVNVTAFNGAGLSTSSLSDGVDIDLTPPTKTIVKDGDDPLVDIDYLDSDSEFSLTWRRIGDPETGINALEVGVGDRALDGVVVMHSVRCNATSYTQRLPLLENHLYYGRVCATNGARNRVCFESDGCLIDSTPPTEGVVMIGLVPPGLRYQAIDTSITAHWYGMIDTQSSIERFEWAIGTSVNQTDVLPFTSVGTNVSRTEYIQLLSGRTYYVFVKAFNEDNLSRTERSEGVLVDVTPPAIPINAVNLTFSGTDRIKGYWLDFVDKDSGLWYYKWAIGFAKYGWQVQRYTGVGQKTSGVSNSIPLELGRQYYVTVEGRNRAGLTSLATSERHVYDNTAPRPFDVFDGNSSRGDIDYQSSNKSLAMSWTDGVGGHSAVRAYYVGVGTDSATDDVQTFTLVPPQSIYSYEFRAISLRQGERYFSLVKCENEVGLSSVSSSDGVVIDATRPLAGSVFTRSYQSNDSAIHAHWSGFRDPESGIDRYFWSISTSDDQLIRDYEDVAIAEEATANGLSLDNQTKYFVNVKAVNKAGLFVTVSSTGLIVDKSPPLGGVIFDGVDNNDAEDADWLQSVRGFGARWEKFSDSESGIAYYRWSIGTYPGGCNVLSAVDVRLQTIARCSNCSFVPGVRYYVTLEATNGAGLSTRVHSDGFLVDVSKPVVGGFGDVKWKRNDLLQMRWKGANDYESGPPKCFVSLVSSDSPSGSASIVNQSLTTAEEQIIQLSLGELDDAVSTLYLFVRCINKAGHSASSLKETIYRTLPPPVDVSLFAHGKHNLTFRWRSELSQAKHAWSEAIRLKVLLQNDSYVKEETFRPRNQAPLTIRIPDLTLSHGMVCTVSAGAISRSGLNSLATVRTFVLPFVSNPLHASDCCIVSVQLRDTNEVNITWNWKNELDEESEELGYEYSYAIGTVPGGGQIRSYTNVGKRREALCRDCPLPYGMDYFVSIRASMDDFKTFIAYQSKGMFSDPTPPISGEVLSDSFFALRAPFSASWNGFKDEDSGIRQCIVSVIETSTGSIIWTSGTLSSRGTGTLTEKNITTWIHSRTYCASVDCSNGVGTFARSLSGNFVVDDTEPGVGVVFVRTFDVIDSNKIAISASWSGFVDDESGIFRYEWAVAEAGASLDLAGHMSDVGVRTEITAFVPISKHGRYRLLVRATNGAGLQSIAKSDELVYDVSPPVGPMFVNDGLGNDDIDYQSSTILSSSWGDVFDDESGIRKCLWYIGRDRGGEQVMAPKTIDLSSTSDKCLDCNPSQGTRYYSTLTCINGVGLNTSSSSDGVLVDFTAPTVGKVYDGTKRSDVNYTMSTVAIDCSWDEFEDEESGVEGYYVCLGTVPNECNVHEAVDTHLSTDWSFRSLALRHLETYYCSVKALNSARLSADSSSDGILVDVTPPVAGVVNDGIKDDVDCLAYNASVAANWFNFYDGESGIVEYQWGIGTTKGDDDVMAFVSVGLEQTDETRIDVPETEMVFVTVLSVNGAGNSIKSTSNGMKIVSADADIEKLGCVVF